MISMQIHPSEHVFFKTFEYWPVPDEWQMELYNYIILGLPPGSFHEACYRNDLLGAAQYSHVKNDWGSIQMFVQWLNEYAPTASWGDEESVGHWLKMDKKTRRKILLTCNLILSKEETTWYVLNKDKQNEES